MILWFLQRPFYRLYIMCNYKFHSKLIYVLFTLNDDTFWPYHFPHKIFLKFSQSVLKAIINLSKNKNYEFVISIPNISSSDFLLFTGLVLVFKTCHWIRNEYGVVGDLYSLSSITILTCIHWREDGWFVIERAVVKLLLV